MPTGYVDPNGDIQKQWASTGAANYTEIDDGTRQPTAAGTGDYVSATTGQDDIYDMTTISGVDTVTSVKLWLYGRSQTSNNYVALYVYMGGTWSTLQNVAFSSGGYGSWSWESATFDGNWTQADLNALQVRMKDAYGAGPWIQVAELYGEVTYSLPVIGSGQAWAFGF